MPSRWVRIAHDQCRPVARGQRPPSAHRLAWLLAVLAGTAVAAPIELDLPAQSLGASVRAVAAQAGLTLRADEALLQGRTAPALRGRLEPEEALGRLLAGTGLRALRVDGALVLTGAAAPAAPAAAAAAGSDAALREVVVSAGAQAVNRYVGVSGTAAARLPADPMDLPVAGVSIPRAVMDDQGVIRAAEAVRNVSAVTRTPAYLGLTDTYRVRGFAADVGLWNGFRRNHYYSFTDTAHLERVEVIKGAASVTYGDLEPGGVVNYVTKRPSRKPVQSAQLTVGSFGLVRPEFDLGLVPSADGTVRLRLTGAHERADSHRDEVRSRHSTLGATLDWDAAPGTRVELSAYWTRSRSVPDRGFFNNTGPVVLQLPRVRFLGEPDDRYDFEQTDVSALVEHRLSPALSLRAGVNRYQTEDERDNFQHRNLQPDGRTVRRQYTLVTSRYSNLTTFGEARADFATGPAKHTLVAGVERIHAQEPYNFRSDRSADYALDIFNPVYGRYARTPGPDARVDFDATSRGLYVQDLIALGEHWRLLAGVRHTRYRQVDTDVEAGTRAGFEQSETTPRLGVLYRVTPEHSVFASYGRSFSPQRFNYATLAPGVAPTPESGRQVELGYKFTALDERLVVGATAFQIRKRNVATTDPADADRVVLTGEQTVRGIELDVSARLGRATSLIASYAHLDGEVSKDNALPVGDRLVNTPRQQASLWLRHDFAGLPGWGAGLGVFLVGAREAQLPNTFTVPGYGRMDASVYWKATPQLDVALHLKNLGDKLYYDSQGNLLYPGAPRSVQVAARYRF